MSTPEDNRSAAEQRREALKNCGSDPESIVKALQKIRDINEKCLNNASGDGRVLRVEIGAERIRLTLDE